MEKATVTASVDKGLRNAFTSECHARVLTASPVIRGFMREFVTSHELNELTAETLRKSARGEEINYAESMDALFTQLGL